MDSSNKRLSQVTAISATSSMEPFNDTTLSTLESKSYLGDDNTRGAASSSSLSLPPPPASRPYHSFSDSDSKTDPNPLKVGSDEGRHLEVGDDRPNRGVGVGRSSHDGIIPGDLPNDLLSRFVRKAASSNSLRGKSLGMELQTDSSSRSSSSKLQPSLASRSSSPSSPHRKASDLESSRKFQYQHNASQIRTSDASSADLPSGKGSTSQSAPTQDSEHQTTEGDGKGGDDEGFQIGSHHHRDATITRKSVERSKSLERRRRHQEQQQQRSQNMTVPANNIGGSSSSLGATSIASGQIFTGLGIDEEIKRQLSIESSTSSVSKERPPSRTASIFRPLGRAFRKKGKGKEKGKEKSKEDLITDGEEEMGFGGGRSWNDEENLTLSSRPDAGSRDKPLPLLLSERRDSRNDSSTYNSPQGNHQTTQGQSSRVSGERSSGSNSGSAMSNFEGGILSGTGTAATSVSGDQRKSLNLSSLEPSNNLEDMRSGSEASIGGSRASSDFDNSFNSSKVGSSRRLNHQGSHASIFNGNALSRLERDGSGAGRSSASLSNHSASEGRASHEDSRINNVGQITFSASEDDADEEDGIEGLKQWRRGKEGSQNKEEMLSYPQESDELRKRRTNSKPSPNLDTQILSTLHSVNNSNAAPTSDAGSSRKGEAGSSQASTVPIPTTQPPSTQSSPQPPVTTRASLGTSRPSEKAVLSAGTSSRSVSGPSASTSGAGRSREKNAGGGGRMAAFSKFLSPKDEDENDFPASTLPTSSAIMGMGSFMNPVYPTSSNSAGKDDSKSSQKSISKKSLKKKQMKTVADAAVAANHSDRDLQSSNENFSSAIKSLADEQESNSTVAPHKPRRSLFTLGLSRKSSISVGHGKNTPPQPFALDSQREGIPPLQRDPNQDEISPFQRDFSPSASPMSSSPRPSIDHSSPIPGPRKARRRPRTSGGEISTNNSGDSWSSFGITKAGNGIGRPRKLSIASGGGVSDRETLDSPVQVTSSPRGFGGNEFSSSDPHQKAPRSRRDSVVSLDRSRSSTGSGLKELETFPVNAASRIDSGGGAAALFGSPRQRASSLLPVFSFGRNRSPSNGALPQPSGISSSKIPPSPSESPVQSHNPLSAIAASIAANDIEAMESMRRGSTTSDSITQKGAGGTAANGSNSLFLQSQTGGLLSASPASLNPHSPSPSATATATGDERKRNVIAGSPTTTSYFPLNAGSSQSQSSQGSNPSIVKKKADTSILTPGPKETPSAYAKRVQKSIPKAEVAATLSMSSDEFSISALRSHMRKYLFAGNPLDIALRKLLMDMRLPKETQQIDRIMEAFAKRYMECNDGLFASEDQPYILAFSLMMLHTDAFNKNAKNKMSKSDYLKNTSSSGVAPEILEYLYDNLTLAEFIYVDDSSELQKRLTDSESPLNPNIFNAISGGVSNSSTKSRIDPYHIIFSGLTSQFRPEIENIIPEDSPYQPNGSIDYDVEKLRKCFLAAPWIEISTSRPSVPTGSAWAGTDYPTTAMISSFIANEPPEAFVTLKITKADLVSRKDDVIEGSKKSRSRKWGQYGMLLTSAQLLFFKDTTWVHALSMQIAKQHREAEMVGQDLSRGFPIHPRVTSFKPDLVISLSDAIAVRDASYSKYEHVFRLVVNQNSDLHGRQYLIQCDSQSDMDDWIAKINYRAAFRSMGIDIRGIQSDKPKANDGGTSGDLSFGSPSLGPTTPTSPESAKFDSYSVRPSLSSSSSSVSSGVWKRRLMTRKALVEPKLHQARENLVKISREVEEEMRLARHLSILTPFQKSTRDRIEAAAVPLAQRLKVQRLKFAQCSSVVDVLAADLAHTEEELQASSGPTAMEITPQQMEQALRVPSSQLGTPQLIEMGGGYSAEQQDFDALFAAAAAANGNPDPSTSANTTSISRRGSARRSERSNYPPPSRSTRASHRSSTSAPGPAPTGALPSLPSLGLSENGLAIETSLLSTGDETPTSGENRGGSRANMNSTSQVRPESSFLSGYDSSASESPVLTRFTRELPLASNDSVDWKGKNRETEAARSSSEAERELEPGATAWFKTQAVDPQRVSLVDLDLPFDRNELERKMRSQDQTHKS